MLGEKQKASTEETEKKGGGLRSAMIPGQLRLIFCLAAKPNGEPSGVPAGERTFRARR